MQVLAVGREAGRGWYCCLMASEEFGLNVSSCYLIIYRRKHYEHWRMVDAQRV